MKLFVAAYPPRTAVKSLRTVVDRLRLGQPTEPGQSVRLQPPERWHLTIAFIGDVADGRLAAATSAIARAAENWRTSGAPAPKVRLAGGGRFGTGRFTTVWVGLDGDVEPLRLLAGTVRRELRRSKLPVDSRSFKPHLTLARPGDRISADALAEDLDTLAGYRGPAWSPASLDLVRSHLGPHPSYETLATAPL